MPAREKQRTDRVNLVYRPDRAVLVFDQIVFRNDENGVKMEMIDDLFAGPPNDEPALLRLLDVFDFN